MAPRDPNKTARYKAVAAIKVKRREMLDDVLAELEEAGWGYTSSEASLNALIGSKADDYLNLKEDLIKTPMEYKSKWLKGLKKHAEQSKKWGNESSHLLIYELLKGDNPLFKKYVDLFLEGSFLKHYEEHYKTKPKVDESEYWFGNNDDEFGLLVTPRFVGGSWENDKSEIRHFKHSYWTLSHVMASGLCYMNENLIRTFTSLEDFLQFFRDMVRRTKSPYQLKLADKYISYVKAHDNPMSVPLLIPELRYDPLKKKHEYRLDFTIINPWTMSKVGFELSPSSTHGTLKGKKKTLKELSEDVAAWFEKEMKKHKEYWRKYGINYIVYTDSDLEDLDEVWLEIRKHLESYEAPDELELHLMKELL